MSHIHVRFFDLAMVKGMGERPNNTFPLDEMIGEDPEILSVVTRANAGDASSKMATLDAQQIFIKMRIKYLERKRDACAAKAQTYPELEREFLKEKRAYEERYGPLPELTNAQPDASPVQETVEPKTRQREKDATEAAADTKRRRVEVAEENPFVVPQPRVAPYGQRTRKTIARQRRARRT